MGWTAIGRTARCQRSVVRKAMWQGTARATSQHTYLQLQLEPGGACVPLGLANGGAIHVRDRRVSHCRERKHVQRSPEDQGCRDVDPEDRSALLQEPV